MSGRKSKLVRAYCAAVAYYGEDGVLRGLRQEDVKRTYLDGDARQRAAYSRLMRRTAEKARGA